jgi:hypothetical protein
MPRSACVQGLKEVYAESHGLSSRHLPDIPGHFCACTVRLCSVTLLGFRFGLGG